jgi:hypothetical protein
MREERRPQEGDEKWSMRAHFVEDFSYDTESKRNQVRAVVTVIQK